MRIIAGNYRGRTIRAPKGDTARPTTDRVRESLMSSLASMTANFEVGTVLDAFAGSGALGLEALSRGVDKVVFYERDAAVFRTLKSNIEGIPVEQNRYVLSKGDVLLRTDRLKVYSFDLVLLDPPYHVEASVIQKLLEEMESFACLQQHAIITYEHAKSTDSAVDEIFSDDQWMVRNVKHFGDISIHIVQYCRNEID